MKRNPKFQIPNSKFFALALLAVLVLTPLVSVAAPITPTSIGITTIHAGQGDFPVYKYVAGSRQGLQIPLRVRLDSPAAIAEGDTLVIGNSSDIEIRGVYLGLSDGAPQSAGHECFEAIPGATTLGQRYMRCSYNFDSDDSSKGFRVIQRLQRDIAQVYPITLTHQDLESLGVRMTNLPAQGAIKDIYFTPVIDLTALITAPDMSLVNGAFAVRIYSFNTQAEADSATVNTSGLVSSRTGGVTGGEVLERSSVADFVGGSLISLVNSILGIIIAILRYVVWILGSLIFVPLLETMLSINAAEITAPIYGGWMFVRDVMNMFFIVVLIVIGFATILKLENYNYKHLLVNLIIMAMLVNFSLVIGRIIIQAADVVQFSFLPIEEVNTSTGQVTGAAGVKAMFQGLSTRHIGMILDGFNGTTDTAGALSTTFTLIFQFVLELGVILTFGALAIFWLIRTVALWILLVISPVAYVLFILPVTAEHAKKWWGNFLKYVLFAPVMAFFLRLTLAVYENSPSLLPANVLFGPGETLSNRRLNDYLNSVGGNMGNIALGDALRLAMIYLMILAFMWAGLLVAKQMGIFGADAIMGLAEKGMKAPFAGGAWLGKRGLKLAGRKWNDFTTKHIRGDAKEVSVGRSAAFALLNPVAAWKGWSKRSEEETTRARQEAEAAGQEVVEQRLTGGKKVLPRLATVQKHHADEFLKDYERLAREVQFATANKIQDMHGPEGEAMKLGLMFATMSRGFVDDQTTDTDDALRAKMGLTDEHYEKNEDGSFKTGPDGRKVVKYNNDTRRRFYKAFFTGDGANGQIDQNTMSLLAEAAEKYGKDTGHWEYLKDFYFDGSKNDGKGEWVFREGKSGSKYAATELSKMDSRTQAKAAFMALMDLNDENGNVDEDLVRTVAAAVFENPTFTQERLAGNLLAGQEDWSEIYNKETGVLSIDEKSFRRINNLMKVTGGAELIAAAFNRQTKSGLTQNQILDRMQGGFVVQVGGAGGRMQVIRDEKRAEKIRAESAPAARTVNEWTKEQPLEPAQKTELVRQLEGHQAAGSMPNFEALISAIEGAVGNKTQAMTLSSNFLDSLAKQKTQNFDFSRELSPDLASQTFAKLSPRELMKLTDAIRNGVREGLVNTSRLPVGDVGGRKAEIQKSIEVTLKSDAVKGIPVPDLDKEINVQRFVDNIYDKIQAP